MAYWGIEWSCDRRRHVTLKGQHHYHSRHTLRVQYLINSWRCYLATMKLVDSLLRGSTVCYPSDSLASCLLCGYRYTGHVLSDALAPGTGPIWIDNVRCGGCAVHLAECSYSGFGYTGCSHQDDVMIACHDRINTTTAQTTAVLITSGKICPQLQLYTTVSKTRSLFDGCCLSFRITSRRTNFVPLNVSVIGVVATQIQSVQPSISYWCTGGRVVGGVLDSQPQCRGFESRP